MIVYQKLCKRWLQRATNWNWYMAQLTVAILMTLGVFKGHTLIANLLRWDFSYILCTIWQYFGGQSTSLIHFTIAELLFWCILFLICWFYFFSNSVLFDFNPLYCIAHLYYVKISASSCVACKMKKKTIFCFVTGLLVMIDDVIFCFFSVWIALWYESQRK